MRCLKCGAAIPEGSLYCPKCGSPVQIVPDYASLENLLADEVNEVLVDDDDKQAFASDARKPAKDSNERADEIAARRRAHEEELRKKKKRRRNLIIILLLSAVIIAIAVFLAFSMSRNSYSYQIGKANKSYAASDYSDALTYYSNAASLKASSAEAKTGMGKCYIRLGDETSAEDNLLKAISVDSSYSDAYLTLASLYESQGSTDKIKSLFDSCSDSSVRDKCAEYIADAPEFSPAAGTFTDTVSVTISSSSSVIYYTTDGSEPTVSSSLYSEPIKLADNGDYTIRAISVNEKGIQSNESSALYTVSIPVPEGPSVSPVSGSYSTATSITVTVPAGSTVYYTLDGSTPTTSSSVYNGPVDMPEGKTVFSCIAVNKNGKTSSVIKRQYYLVIVQ